MSRVTVSAETFERMLEERDRLAREVREQQETNAWLRRQLERAKADLERTVAIRSVSQPDGFGEERGVA